MAYLWQKIDQYLEQSWFILTLIVINFLGSIYGFYWYKYQLLETPKKWLIFVPDSPTSSTFFTLFLIFYYFRKKSPLIEAMASITSFKYGIWAVVMILWGALARDSSLIKILTIQSITWSDVMLMGSHLGMALEAILFFKKYSYGIISVLLIAVWTLFNDYIDYSQDVHPWLAESISNIDPIVARFTVGLSILTILLFYFLSYLRRKQA
ncbi:DUF1405 domain-containing protein [Tepidibacillus fermentans]|uniref:Putative membrane protein YpjA n=1 Tax=Tepidibacillus fermentans TaxID=1281767 RepID=A0A4R3KK40_9BACI|nr:DUF1405 domain-containing protein [Tepidibacillus fermentans]TCS84153.1 putative membrane protein YpjA [Tepidibacillus fermentans]